MLGIICFLYINPIFAIKVAHVDFYNEYVNVEVDDFVPNGRRPEAVLTNLLDMQEGRIKAIMNSFLSNRLHSGALLDEALIIVDAIQSRDQRVFKYFEYVPIHLATVSNDF